MHYNFPLFAFVLLMRPRKRRWFSYGKSFTLVLVHLALIVGMTVTMLMSLPVYNG